MQARPVESLGRLDFWSFSLDVHGRPRSPAAADPLAMPLFPAEPSIYDIPRFLDLEDARSAEVDQLVQYVTHKTAASARIMLDQSMGASSSTSCSLDRQSAPVLSFLVRDREAD